VSDLVADLAALMKDPAAPARLRVQIALLILRLGWQRD
jgi:hypothetical protein